VSHQPLLKHIDLFAGCGGLSLGLEQAGFTSIFVNEINKDALESYIVNRDYLLGGVAFNENKALHSNDICSLNKTKLEEIQSNLKSLDIGVVFERNGESNIDVIAGGPPCQGYSRIGHRRSYGVDKNKLPSNLLYKHMGKFIRFMKPRIFLFENVEGLKTAKWTSNGEKGEIWQSVWGYFSELAKKENYKIRWSLLHSKKYGIPQNRPRVMIVGIRNDVVSCSSILSLKNDESDAVSCNFLPYPVITPPPDVIDVLGDLIDTSIKEVLLSNNYPEDSFCTSKYPSDPEGSIQEYFRMSKNGKKMTARGDLITEHVYSRHRKDVVDRFDYMISNNGEYPVDFKTKKFAQRVLPKRWNGQGPNITITSLPDDYVHFEQPRSITVREWARLQMFPDWYQFKGPRTTGGERRAGNPIDNLYERDVPKYSQIGNAVPVSLAKCIGRHFKRILLDSQLIQSTSQQTKDKYFRS